MVSVVAILDSRIREPSCPTIFFVLLMERGAPPLPRLEDTRSIVWATLDSDRLDVPAPRLGYCVACTQASPHGFRTLPYQVYGLRQLCGLCLQVDLLVARARRLRRSSGEFEHFLELLQVSAAFVERSLAGPAGHVGLEEFENLRVSATFVEPEDFLSSSLDEMHLNDPYANFIGRDYADSAASRPQLPTERPQVLHFGAPQRMHIALEWRHLVLGLFDRSCWLPGNFRRFCAQHDAEAAEVEKKRKEEAEARASRHITLEWRHFVVGLLGKQLE